MLTKARQALSNVASAITAFAPTNWARVYEAAKRTGFDGYFYIPHVTPSEKMDECTRRILVERSDWLCDNCPPVGMAIDSLALDEVGGGGIWPKWDTGNPKFDVAMTDAYHNANHDPRIFSANGQDECYGAQYTVRRIIPRYGDGFGQLLRPEPGKMMPSMAIYPGYIVDNFGDEKPESGWKDGILSDKMGRPLKYRVLNAEHPTGYTDVDALDLLHFHDPFLPGQRRGLPILTPVVKDLFRMEDIKEAIANGTLAREMLGFAIENGKADQQFGPALPGSRATTTATNTDGSQYRVQKFFGMRGQGQVPIPELKAGQTFQMLESNRPGTAVMDFLDSILRQLAWARKCPPEYLFFNDGGQGTGWRLIMQRVKTMITGAREFQLRPQFLHRWHVFWAWQLIKSGYFAQKGIQVPENWWQHKLIYPADITVDLAREGRLYAELVATNKMSIDSYHGLMGEDVETVDGGNLKIITRRHKDLEKLNKELGTELTYLDVWPRTANNNTAATPANDNTDDGSTPPPPPAKKNGANGHANRFSLT